MESIETNDIWNADWQYLLFSKSQTSDPGKTGWNHIVFIIVIFLHIVVIGHFFLWQQLADSRMDAPQDALEITFIERTSMPEQAVAPAPPTKKISAVKSTMESSGNIVAVTQHAENGNKISPAGLRLTFNNDEWNTSPLITERNPLKRQHVELAGRAEPFIKGIKLRNKLTPQQKLAMVGKLFGAVEYDPCIEASRRLASGQSQLNEIDLEADLRSIENHCRP
ncbi:MAG: hypothetical protein ABI644_11565 [Arenimonas sp.]